MDTKAMDMEKEQKIRRFASGRIAEHLVLIVTFTVLAVTGLSQKFYYLDVSRWLIFQLGGIDAVRLIHRYAGIAFALLALEHLATAVVGVSVFRWQPTMMVTKKDFRDAAHNVKYYIGIAKAPAACGRYDYKEKFNYWLVLTGGVVMILTGFTLWFPIGVVKYLPGEAIPLAKALHSNEALLIFLLIIVWHIYDSIFSPDVFPMDTSIFTGYTTRRKMLRLHPLELASLEGASPEETLVERARATGQMGFDT
ncbi:MAG: cytochrome b/b6 domain-containing protein [Nitrospirota bacterium]|jgi:formate dehydrogenase subunit gamma